MSFGEELTQLLNRHSIEIESNTPDFILAQYIRSCLTAFSVAVVQREAWYRQGPVMAPSPLGVVKADGD